MAILTGPCHSGLSGVEKVPDCFAIGLKESRFLRADEDLSVIDEDDVVGDTANLFRIMGDDQHGIAAFSMQVEKEISHRLAKAGIECGERLVENQNRLLSDECAGKGDALTFAT